MPAPTITPLVAALLAGGALAGGAGAALSASQTRKSEREKAQLAALGPVRGGSARAGNQGLFGLDPSIVQKLAQTMMPIKTPVYGEGMPVDLAQPFQPRPFGTGFNLGGQESKYTLPNVPRRMTF